MCFWGSVLLLSSMALSEPIEWRKQAQAFEKSKQYDEAEKLYQRGLLDASLPDQMLAAHRDLVLLYVVSEQWSKAQAQYAQLLTACASHQDLSQAIYDIGKRYRKEGKDEQALDVHQNNFKRHPKNKFAMLSQAEIVDYYLAQNRASDAEAATNDLIQASFGSPDLAEPLLHIGKSHTYAMNLDKAVGIYQYVAEYFPTSKYGMWGQVELIKLYFDTTSDTSSRQQLDDAVNELSQRFASQHTLPRELLQIARRYRKSGQSGRALELDQYIIQNFPDDLYAVCAEIQFKALKKNDIEGSITKLLSQNSSHPELSSQAYILTDILNQVEQFDQSIRLYQHYVDHWPTGRHGMRSQHGLAMSYIREKEDVKADEAISTLLTKYKSHDGLAEAMYEIELLLYNQKEMKEARTLTEFARETVGKENKYAMWSQIELVKSYIRDANFPEAEIALQRLSEDFANQPTLQIEITHIADTYVRAGALNYATELYEHVQTRWPTEDGHFRAMVGKTRVAVARGMHETVDVLIETLMTKYQDHEDLAKAIWSIGDDYYNLALEKHEKKETDEAFAQMHRCIAVWQTMVTELPVSEYTKDAKYFIGVCYRRFLGDYEKALQYYEEVASDWPDYKYAWSAQGMIGPCYEQLARQGKIDSKEAAQKKQRAYEAVISNYPDCSFARGAYLRLGQIHMNGKRWDVSGEYYTQYLARYPKNNTWRNVLIKLAQTYERRNDPDTAKALYHSYLAEADPLSQGFRQIQVKLEKMEGAM